MTHKDVEERGLDPNSVTGTKDTVDPETGTVGTAGTPLTAGYGQSGSTIGIGSQAGEEQEKKNDNSGTTSGTRDYTSGQND